MTLNYIFKTERPCCADGNIIFDIDTPSLSCNAMLSLYWGSEKAIPLPDYTPIATLNGESIGNGYSIDKQLCIPYGAKYVIATLTDGDMTETAAFELPQEKLAPNRGQPLYTVGFASDFHIGGWGSEAEPKAGLIKAREEFNKLVDFLVTEGDLIQWHGCFSGEEFKKYNYDPEAKKWGDNGERDPQYIGIGKSQWDMLDEYMAGFTIPVYHCQGNHDIIDEDHWSPMAGNEDYFGEFLTKWIKYSEESGKYEDHIERDESVHYYETTVRGHKFVFTEAPRPSSPHDRVGEEQLAWLDRILFDGEESGKPIFVVGHSPICPELNKKTAYAKFSDLDKLIEVLDKHPTVIYVSGHSHYTLDTPVKNMIDGRQEKPSHLHNGGMTTTIDPPPMTQYNITHGTVAEVYEDGILIRGRNHTTAQWISLGLTELIFKKPCKSGNIRAEKIEADGKITFTAHAENADGITFEWFVDGEVISTESTLTLSDPHDYIALRAKDENGGFRSTIVTP